MSDKEKFIERKTRIKSQKIDFITINFEVIIIFISFKREESSIIICKFAPQKNKNLL